MLSYLAIRNLAVIERLELELGAGLTVISGETGAGKSMLMAGLDLLLGGKVKRERLRSGETAVVVEGAWDSWDGVGEGVLEEEDEEVLVRRKVMFGETSRRDRMWICERLTPRRVIHQVAPALVNISSQHEYVSLLKKSEHLVVLDRFAGVEGLVGEMAGRYEAFAALDGRLGRLVEEAGRRKERIRWLRETRVVLEEADVREGEETELYEQIARLSHAVEIEAALQGAVDALYERDGAAVGCVDAVVSQLAGVVKYESGVEELVDRLEAARTELEDVVTQLRHLEGKLDAEPGLLDHLQERLALLQKLARRYGVDDGDGLVGLLDEVVRELAELEDTEESLGTLEKERDAARLAMVTTARELHAEREKAARRLETALAEVLGELEMPRARFRVAVALDEEKIGKNGGDAVEFLLSANPGQPPMALQKIASGGELSRVLLALKAVLADAYPVPTYVFDEIDAGIGGKTALAVGRLLAQLARSAQVLCVTHTAQIAAYADHHLVVRKGEVDGRTATRVETLGEEREKVAELARMLSGLESSESALEHARELRVVARGR